MTFDQPEPWLWAALGGSLAMLAVAAWLILRLRRAYRLRALVITGLQQSQNELQDQMRILQSILDSMSDGIAVADERGRLRLLNPAAERILGMGLGEATESRWSEHFGLYLADETTPYPTAELPLARAIRGEVCDDIDLFVRNPSLPEGRWLNVRARPLTDRAGVARGGVAVFSDNTTRRRGDEEIRRLNVNLEERVHARTAELERNRSALQAIIENVPAAVFVKDLDGRYVRHNARLTEVLGRPGESVVGLRDDALIDGASAARVIDQDRQVAATGRVLRSEHEVRAPDGQLRTYQTHIFPFHDVRGQCYAVGGISLDITDLKHAQRAAEAATRVKSEFLANMSHEIRTPMNAILGMSHLALHSGLNPRQHNYVQKVHAAAESLLGIINDILDFSKVEAGKLDIESIPFDLADVMENLGGLMGMQAEQKGLALQFVYAPELPTALVGDPSRLGQVLINLGNNAVKFTEHGGVTVTIDVLDRDASGLHVRFEVRDTGVGMDLDQQQRLFQPFSQADASTSRRYGGTGLGLAISQQLVRLMGGELRVDSVPAQGSRFHFSVRFGLQPAGSAAPRPHSHGGLRDLRALVADDDDCDDALGLGPLASARTERHDGTRHDQRTSLSGARVLLVEDNAINQELAVEVLNRAGVVVSVAGNGQEALDALARESFDAVLMDCQMPVMDGYAATRALRRQPPLAQLPVIAMTANAMVGDRDKVLAAGMNDHIAKPIDLEELYATLARWVRPAADSPATSSHLVDGQPTPDLLAGLPGVDTRAGVAMVSGDLALYRRLLRIFRDREASFAARFRAARAQGDVAAAARTVHDLKSVSAMLSMPGVQRAAVGLDEACRVDIAGDATETWLREVSRELDPVVEALQSLGPDPAAWPG